MAEKGHETDKDAAPPMFALDSPEIGKMIADRVAMEVAKIEAQKSRAAAPASARADSAAAALDDKAWMSSLALSFAELAGQNSGKVYVDPEVLKQRMEARERMTQLCESAWAARDEPGHIPPQYVLTGKVELANQCVEPAWVGADHIGRPTEIDYYGVPNDVMQPINAAAKAIKDEWVASVGNMKRIVPEDRLGMTRGGLVVRNSAIPGALGQRMPTVGVPSDVSDDGKVRIHGKTNPGAKVAIPVLGTIHKAAQGVAPHPGQQRV
jgi:hypothetical protein